MVQCQRDASRHAGKGLHSMSRRNQVRGITRLAPGRYKVRVRATNPKTGKEVTRFETLEGVTLAVAAARKAELRQELLDELHGPPRPERVTLRTYATSWLASSLPNLTETTSKRYASDLEIHILPKLGDLFLDEVTGQDIRHWQAGAAMAEKADGGAYSPESVNGWFRILHTLLTAAVADGLIPFNPATHIKPIQDRRIDHDKDALTPTELRQVLALAKKHEPDHYAVMATLALTGARHGEVSALRWEDIDVGAGIIRIRRSATRGKVGRTKSGKIRVVGLSPVLQDILREQYNLLVEQNHPGLDAGWVFPTLGKLPKGAPRDDPRPVALRYHTALAKPLKRLMKRAGISKHCSAHSLRRSNVDALRLMGIDSVVEHATVGHSSERMRAHYSHVHEEERRQAAESVANLLFSPEPVV